MSKFINPRRCTSSDLRRRELRPSRRYLDGPRSPRSRRAGAVERDDPGTARHGPLRRVLSWLAEGFAAAAVAAHPTLACLPPEEPERDRTRKGEGARLMCLPSLAVVGLLSALAPLEAVAEVRDPAYRHSGTHAGGPANALPRGYEAARGRAERIRSDRPASLLGTPEGPLPGIRWSTPDEWGNLGGPNTGGSSGGSP